MTGAGAPPIATAPRERLLLTHVEGLRAIAALLVFLNHAYAQSGFPGHYPSAPWYLAIFGHSMVIGHLSVSVFIVISGFCLALPVVEANGHISSGVWQFIQRRARRILPPYYCALALSLLLIATIIGKPTGSLWDVPIQVGWTDVVSHLLLLQDLFGTGRINYVFWSIAVEWQIYFLFPLLVWAARRYGMPFMALGALIFGYAILIAFSGTRVDRANPHFLGLFALGILAAHVVRAPSLQGLRERTQGIWRWLALASLLVACTLVYHWGWLAPLHFPPIDLPVGIMAFALLIHTTLRERSWATRFFNTKGVVLIGTFSYSLYLVHAPLLQIIWQYGTRPLNFSRELTFLILCTIGLALTLVLSYLFFLLCEKPFMRSQRRAAVTTAESAALGAR